MEEITKAAIKEMKLQIKANQTLINQWKDLADNSNVDDFFQPDADEMILNNTAKIEIFNHIIKVLKNG